MQAAWTDAEQHARTSDLLLRRRLASAYTQPQAAYDALGRTEGEEGTNMAARYLRGGPHLFGHLREGGAAHAREAAIHLENRAHARGQFPSRADRDKLQDWMQRADRRLHHLDPQRVVRRAAHIASDVDRLIDPPQR